MTICTNLEVLSRFQPGQSPVIDREKNSLSIESRIAFVSLRRGWTKAFDPMFIEELFDQAFSILTLAQNHHKLNEEAEKIQKIFPAAISGCKTLSETYRSKQKENVALSLEKIYESSIKRFALYQNSKKEADKKFALPKQPKEQEPLLPKDSKEIKDQDPLLTLIPGSSSQVEAPKEEEGAEEPWYIKILVFLCISQEPTKGVQAKFEAGENKKEC